MDFIKRIGTDKHKFKVEFYIGELLSNTMFKGSLFIVIKRGNHKKTTEQIIKLNEDKKCNFKHEKLQFPGITLFYDNSTSSYQQKMGEIRLIMQLKQDQNKIIGVIPFDVSSYSNLHQQTFKQSKKFTKCPQKVSVTLNYQVYIKYIGEASQASVSVNKNNEKRQSSLTKFANFLGLSKKQEQPTKKVEESKNVLNNKLRSKNLVGKNNFEDQDQMNKSQVLYSFNPTQLKNKNTNLSNSQHFPYTETPKKLSYLDKQNLSNSSGSGIYVDYQASSMYKTKQENTHFLQKKDSNNANEEALSSNRHYQKKLVAELQQNNKMLYQKVANIQKSNYHLQSQNLFLRKENQFFRKENVEMLQEINSLKQEKVMFSQSYIRETVRQAYVPNEQLLNKIRQLERQKGELLISLEKINEKYQKDFTKYEQILDQHNHKKQSIDEEIKIQLKKVKEEASDYRAKIEELIEQLEDKSNQNATMMKQNNKIGALYGKMQQQLSQLKMKIAEEMNTANNNQQKRIAQVLTKLTLI